MDNEQKQTEHCPDRSGAPLEERIAELERAVSLFSERNQRVEADKAWEVSGTRIVLIASITYTVALIVLMLTKAAFPAYGAIVPALGYLLSTLSLPAVKKRWLAGRSKRFPRS